MDSSMRAVKGLDRPPTTTWRETSQGWTEVARQLPSPGVQGGSEGDQDRDFAPLMSPAALCRLQGLQGRQSLLVLSLQAAILANQSSERLRNPLPGPATRPALRGSLRDHFLPAAGHWQPRCLNPSVHPHPMHPARLTTRVLPVTWLCCMHKSSSLFGTFEGMPLTDRPLPVRYSQLGSTLHDGTLLHHHGSWRCSSLRGNTLGGHDGTAQPKATIAF